MIGLDFIVFSKYKQDIIYYLLPKKQNDYLLINMPVLILEPVSKWIDSKMKMDLNCLFGTSKYSFVDAHVDDHKIYTNRYNIESREILVKFKLMMRGYSKSIL